LIQNGLGVERALYEAVKDQGCPVMGGMAWIGVMTRDEGRVVEWRGPVSSPLHDSIPVRLRLGGAEESVGGSKGKVLEYLGFRG
jgi:ketopantoate reductase